MPDTICQENSDSEPTVLPVPTVGHSDALDFPAPIHDNIILEVEQVPSEQTTGSGIIIPTKDQARKHPTVAIVKAVGQGRPTDTGEHQALTVAVGDRVLFDHQPHVAYAMNWEGKQYVVTRELYVHAILPHKKRREEATKEKT